LSYATPLSQPPELVPPAAGVSKTCVYVPVMVDELRVTLPTARARFFLL
jgi:hypothetical protein